MKVTQVSTWRTPCGIAHYTEFLGRGLDAAGVESDVVPIDIPLTRRLSRQELDAYFTSLADRASDADVVHLQHEFAFFTGRQGRPASARRLARFIRRVRAHGTPLAITFHTDPPRFAGSRPTPTDLAMQASWAMAWRPGVARLLSGDDGVTAIVHSARSRACLIDSGVRPDAIRVIPHGIGALPGDLDALRDDARRRMRVAPDDVVLGMFGFIAGYKGHLTALKALTRLPGRYRLAIIGGPHPESDDRTMEVLLEYIRRHPELEGRVTITGYLPDAQAAPWVAACDLMLAPYAAGTEVSASGALSIALASGRPVIGTRIPSFVELNRHHACLALALPDAPNALAIAIEQLDDDPTKQKALVGSAAQVVAEHSWQRMARLHVDAYEGRPRTEVRTTARHVAADAATQAQPVIDPARRRSGIHHTTEVSAGRSVTFVLDPTPGRDPLVHHLLNYGFAHDPPNVIVRQLMGPGRRLLDVGAHVGTFSLAAVADGGLAIAIEASREGVRYLRDATDANGFHGRFSVVHGVADEASGDEHLFLAGGLYGMVVPEPDPDAQVISSVAIDDVLDDFRWEEVDVVKMDIEGFEVRAIRGMRRLLERCSPVFVIECNAEMLRVQGHTARELREVLEAHGYALFVIDRTRHHQLITTSADDIQTEAAVDLVAWRHRPSNLGDWRVMPALEPWQIAQRLARQAESESPGLRRFAAETLVAAPADVADDPRAISTLARLRTDPSDEVRQVVNAHAE